MHLRVNKKYSMVAVIVLAVATGGWAIFRHQRFSPPDHITASAVTAKAGHTVDPSANASLPKASVVPSAKRMGVPTMNEAVDEVASEFMAKPGKVYGVSNLASEYAQLAASATNGDLVAARTLDNAVRVCRLAPRDKGALEMWRKKVQDPKYKYASSPDGGAQVLAYHTSLYKHCGALSDDQLDSEIKWASQLADAGDSDARVQFGALAPTDYDRVDFDKRRSDFVEKAKRYFNEEIDAGNAVALSAMGRGYLPPIIQGQATTFQLDPEAAYKYYFAYAMSPAAQPYSQSIDTILARLEAQLTAAQIDEARKAGSDIYQRCCS